MVSLGADGSPGRYHLMSPLYLCMSAILELSSARNAGVSIPTAPASSGSPLLEDCCHRVLTDATLLRCEEVEGGMQVRVVVYQDSHQNCVL